MCSMHWMTRASAVTFALFSWPRMVSMLVFIASSGVCQHRVRPHGKDGCRQEAKQKKGASAPLSCVDGLGQIAAGDVRLDLSEVFNDFPHALCVGAGQQAVAAHMVVASREVDMALRRFKLNLAKRRDDFFDVGGACLGYCQTVEPG